MKSASNIFSLFLTVLVLIGCQSKEKRPGEIDSSVQTQPNLQNSHLPIAPTVPAVSEDEAPKIETGSSYTTAKIGLILGPGAIRSYAHVGIVTEFAKAKLPVEAIAGMEMGALVAAIYANKGQPYDVEWQMMKLKESDLVQKGLLSSSIKAGDVQSLNEFINISLSSSRVENSKINFSCPAFHLVKRQTYIMNKGVFSQMLPYCLSFPPLFVPYQQNISGVFDLKPMVDYMKNKGINYIIYVDILSGNNKLDSSDFEIESLWALAAANLMKQEKSVNEVIRIPLQEYTLTDFKHRREIMQKGQQFGQKAAQDIRKKLGM